MPLCAQGREALLPAGAAGPGLPFPVCGDTRSARVPVAVQVPFHTAPLPDRRQALSRKPAIVSRFLPHINPFWLITPCTCHRPHTAEHGPVAELLVSQRAVWCVNRPPLAVLLGVVSVLLCSGAFFASARSSTTRPGFAPATDLQGTPGTWRCGRPSPGPCRRTGPTHPARCGAWMRCRPPFGHRDPARAGPCLSWT